MESIGRALAILVLIVGIASTTACESASWTTVQIVGNHPWEKASGRQFWYTLLYRDDTDLRQVNLPIGVRGVVTELLQDDVQPGKIEAELARLLFHTDYPELLIIAVIPDGAEDLIEFVLQLDLFFYIKAVCCRR